jgi:hypothetical protein
MWPFNSPKNELEAPTLAVIEPPTAVTSTSPEDSEQLTFTSGPIPKASSSSFTEILANPNFHFLGYPNERLGMPAAVRAPFITGASFITGFGLGVTAGGRKAADRYRAENSHRFPTTQAGWYLYHRSKSYNTIVGGVKEGVKFGSQITLFAGAFMGIEEIMDRSRSKVFTRGDEDYATGQKDFVNTVIAGMSTSGLYILWKRMDVFAAGKMARMALKYSLAYGLAQDLLASVKGESPAYVRWAMSKIRKGEISRSV